MWQRSNITWYVTKGKWLFRRKDFAAAAIFGQIVATWPQGIKKNFTLLQYLQLPPQLPPQLPLKGRKKKFTSLPFRPSYWFSAFRLRGKLGEVFLSAWRKRHDFNVSSLVLLLNILGHDRVFILCNAKQDNK